MEERFGLRILDFLKTCEVSFRESSDSNDFDVVSSLLSVSCRTKNGHRIRAVSVLRVI